MLQDFREEAPRALRVRLREERIRLAVLDDPPPSMSDTRSATSRANAISCVMAIIVIQCLASLTARPGRGGHHSGGVDRCVKPELRDRCAFAS